MANPQRGVHIAGAGCALADYVFPCVDFGSASFTQYCTVSPGDGGLEPGHLVFRTDFEAFAGLDVETAIGRIGGDARTARFNVGGPSVVAMVIASQLLQGRPARVSFHGASGDDETGRRIRQTLAKTPLDIAGYRIMAGPSPSTYVFSDPTYRGGQGERTFINTIGAAAQFAPEHLDDRFFQADIHAYGATALVPRLHAGLTQLLERSRASGGITVVHTVYDFASEKRNPGGRWPLGDDEGTYPLIDLLVTNADEAMRISGAADVASACRHFMSGGIHALAVTHGVHPVRFCSDGSLFAECPPTELPVCDAIVRDRTTATGDTTGCGDNFVGGLLASLSAQKASGTPVGAWHLPRAVAVGICAGGCACFHVGGLYVETTPGEKTRVIGRYYSEYRRQEKATCALPAEML